MCDICYPKAPVARPRTARVSVARASTRAVRGSGTGRPVAAPAPPPDLLDQRVFHVTALSNLAGILRAGGLVAGESPEVDVSSALARELRSSAIVPAMPGAPGLPVSAYVPWYLSPDATIWNELRGAAAGPRWSTAARAVASANLVVLVSTLRSLTEGATADDIVVADRDAAGTDSKFAIGSERVVRMLGQLYGSEHVLAAELLVKHSVPFRAVHLVGVANEPQRDRVREILISAGLRTKVVVYPPWFAPLTSAPTA